MSEQAIIQMKTQSIHAELTPVSHGILQRCSNGVECAECRKKRETSLQRVAVNTTPTNGVPSIVHDVLRSPGQPLDADTRSFMESRFSHDFSGVRVHSDTQSASSAKAIDALAYTVGNNIVFGKGQYAPETNRGKKILAHELIHVLQQGAPQQGVRASSLNIGMNDENNLEEEAHRGSILVGKSSKTLTINGQIGQHIQRIKPTGLDPSTPRSDPDIEAQRNEAIKIVRSNCSAIGDASRAYGIAAEAIAGAILWEALENPYHR